MTDTDSNASTNLSTSASASANAGRLILDVKDLSVDFFVEKEWIRAVDRISYQVHSGEVLGIVGESGSGKSQSSMSLIGLLPRNGRATGKATLYEEGGASTQLLGESTNQLLGIRGAKIATIFQEPMTALNPLYTVGFQIVETISAHLDITTKQARARALELLEMVQLPDPKISIDKYPHQLSGGQRQRVMIAQALALDPLLLIADEPTTALDVTVQAEILELMRDLKHRVDAGIILITHDMGVVADMADNVCVMKDGVIVEKGSVNQIFYSPKHSYTQELLAAVPRLKVGEGGATSPAFTAGSAAPAAPAPLAHAAQEALTTATPAPEAPTEVPPVPALAAQTTAPKSPADSTESARNSVLKAHSLYLEYPKHGRTPAFLAVEDFNLIVGESEVVGLVGESGSGKSTVGRAVVGLLPPKSGSLEVCGVELANVSKKNLKLARKDVSIVFQDPGSSLNPRIPIGASIGEPLLLNKKFVSKNSALLSAAEAAGHPLTKDAINARIDELLEVVRLPKSYRNRYPHELSGGQRQRIGIARALALKPRLLIADEPTSALDVSVQATVLELFKELQKEQGFACLFISHDLAVVELVSSRIVVLSKGRIVETGSAEQILYNPQHQYTKELISAVPHPDPILQKQRREDWVASR